MQFKSILLPLLMVASVHASTTAIKTFGDRNADARALAARTTTATRVTGTVTVTKTVTTTPTATSVSADCCTCFKALAGEGLACAAAILEEGCNLLADWSCIVDAIALGDATPACLHCIGL
ncbi:hypothetical protein B0H13DRAFT_300442 [Mycena leptocephala]|nr:hypothetical protein B0H13DRAFT_391126 [Mycena leptocephala]KAJ7828205.1 hypothetical protein B0H13DRAFT_300442 [Mycena leptocephala]